MLKVFVVKIVYPILSNYQRRPYLLTWLVKYISWTLSSRTPQLLSSQAILCQESFNLNSCMSLNWKVGRLSLNTVCSFNFKPGVLFFHFLYFNFSVYSQFLIAWRIKAWRSGRYGYIARYIFHSKIFFFIVIASRIIINITFIFSAAPNCCNSLRNYIWT